MISVITSKFYSHIEQSTIQGSLPFIREKNRFLSREDFVDAASASELTFVSHQLSEKFSMLSLKICFESLRIFKKLQNVIRPVYAAALFT